jgi:hypothetical protein
VPNDPQTDLVYAILALDSYNRGYGAGISGLLTSGANAGLGNWSVVTTATDELDDPQSAGFYAIAYRNTATSEVVISYRGTDNKNPSGPGSDPAKFTAHQKFRSPLVPTEQTRYMASRG